jgi:hypothetical protein
MQKVELTIQEYNQLHLQGYLLVVQVQHRQQHKLLLKQRVKVVEQAAAATNFRMI